MPDAPKTKLQGNVWSSNCKYFDYAAVWAQLEAFMKAHGISRVDLWWDYSPEPEEPKIEEDVSDTSKLPKRV